MNSTDYYRTLDVRRDASLADIKTAFRRKALAVHPDQGGSDEAFRELKVAFEHLVTHHTAAPASVIDGLYDPFGDPNYHSRIFFAPEHDMIAEFERSVRAQGCPYCHGRGVISKLVDPSRGFFGREERFCRCQIVQ